SLLHLRTVLGAPGGEIPPGDSSLASFLTHALNDRSWSNNGHRAAQARNPSVGIGRGCAEQSDLLEPPGRRCAVVVSSCTIRLYHQAEFKSKNRLKINMLP
ncbi:MAG: hypothetical protein WA858_19280, partial [Xanthobacteraceae bacterium]